MIELSEGLVDAIADRLAPRIAERVAREVGDSRPPWMNFDGLCEYTQIPRGTLRRMVADGTIPKHGTKKHVFYREEVDRALLNYPRDAMRQAS